MSKTTELPGMTGEGVAPIKLPEIDVLVHDYVDKRDLRMERTRQEVEAKTRLIGALRKNADKLGTTTEGTIVYRHDDLVVTLKHGKDDLKVRTEGGEEDGNGDTD